MPAASRSSAMPKCAAEEGSGTADTARKLNGVPSPNCIVPRATTNSLKSKEPSGDSPTDPGAMLSDVDGPNDRVEGSLVSISKLPTLTANCRSVINNGTVSRLAKA
jgi:hypothetical protein